MNEPGAPRGSVPPTGGASAAPARPRWRIVMRVVLAVALSGALTLIALNARSQLHAAGVSRSLIRAGKLKVPEPAAIQAALVYAQAAFQALIALGLAIGGYLLTRLRD